MSAAACEVGDLDFGSGLLVLLERALDRLAPDETLTVTADAGLEHDLPAWCRRAGHQLVASTVDGTRARHEIRRGPHGRLAVRERPELGLRAPLRRGAELDLRDIRIGRAGQVPERADPATGFAPRGAVVEAGSPVFAFTLCERERVWADEAAELYEQGNASVWSPTRDIPWAQLQPLPDAVEESVGQVMTFLAENELSALYVPARFVPRIHPAFIEVVLFLAQQQAEEARHYEAFVKRALANGGGLGVTAASSMASLETLLDQEDFPAAHFLLSVLGEGTFVDLLRFLETHAPDPAMREIVRRARIDEARHAHFGVAHTRAFLRGGAKNERELLDAARARAGTLAEITRPSPVVLDSLAILAGGSLAPSDIRRGWSLVRDLDAVMHENRVKRLVSCGFSPQLAVELSSLHTANFM